MTAVPFEPADEPFVSLATFRKNGREVQTPIWIAALNARYYCFSAGRAGKVKRIRLNGRARLAPCNMRGDIRGDWIDAHGRIIDDATLIAEVYAAFRCKYGWQMALTDLFARLTRRYRRRAILEFELVTPP